MLQYQIVLIPFDSKIIEIKAIKKKKKETVASSQSRLHLGSLDGSLEIMIITR